MYEYRIKEFARVVDGDTVDLIIDLGFDILHKTRVRLHGINAPESRTRDLEEKEKGLAAKERLTEILEDYIKGDIDADSLREIGGQSLVSDADRIKSASKGAKPKATIIPGVKTKERAPVNIDTLKTLNFTSKAGKYSWHDVVNQIYIKKGRGLSIADDYLSGDINIDDFKLTYRTRRDRAEKIKQRFKELGISIEEFKKKHSKDYKTLINLLGKSRTK